MTDTRCRSEAYMPSGVYRCVYESGHMRRDVGPQEHQYNYYRAFTPDEAKKFNAPASALPAETTEPVKP